MIRRPLPVLLLIFNRADTTRAVIRALSVYRPTHLYVAADGPRPGHGEEAACAAARNAAVTLSWECTVHTLLRDGNLGLRAAVSGAIDWFFEHEEEGIILEDDCVPVPSFFPYCEELLERFRDDQRVMAISGDNFQRGREITLDSYYFSKYPHCWGWATWRRAWQLYDHDLVTLDAFEAAGGPALWADGSPPFAERFRTIFRAVREGRINSWAYCWTYSCWAHNGLTCLPAVNLVRNIGFSEQGTHTRSADAWMADLACGELELPLRHPEVIVRRLDADQDSAMMVYGINDPNYLRWPWLQRHLLNPLRGLKARLLR